MTSAHYTQEQSAGEMKTVCRSTQTGIGIAGLAILCPKLVASCTSFFSHENDHYRFNGLIVDSHDTK